MLTDFTYYSQNYAWFNVKGLNFDKNELIHVHFTSELKNFLAYCAFLAIFGFI